MNTLFPYAACLQLKIQSGDINKNIRHFQDLLAAQQFPENTLLVLPEVWASGFDYPNATKLAEQSPALLELLHQEAAQRKLWIAGSLLEPQKDGKPSNTLFLVGPNGVLGSYQKHHLFRFWQEEEYLQAGSEPLPIATPFGLLGALICYDLRFPEISHRHAFAGCRILIVSAQWPASRLEHWRLLVQARAVENQCFVVACNGCGAVGEGYLAGHSLIVDPSGTILAEAGQEVDCIQTPLEEEKVDKLRSRFCTCGERPWSGWDNNKIVTLATLEEQLALIRQQNSRIVFTNGCFDLLHAGHVEYLEQARSCGDCLIVAVNADSSVRKLKGETRPINSEQERARVLAALGCVDFVVLFCEETPLELIKTIQPDVLVKGADWPEEQISGAAEVKAAGGTVERIPFSTACSTSKIITKIRADQSASSL